ncbi:MAG: acyltransferase, partial [Culicoidibacterales bacterium]
IVRVNALPVPQVDGDRYFAESEYRAEFQRWLNQLWAEKDHQIHALLQTHQSMNNKATSPNHTQAS